MSKFSPEYKDIHTAKKRKLLHAEMEKVANKIQAVFKKNERVSVCVCCRGANISRYTEKFGFGLDRCEDCGHIFTNPFPSQEALDFYYNSDFKEFENEFFLDSFENRVPIFIQRLELIDELLGSGSILDVGSAVGIFLEANIRAGSKFDITACDLNRSSCDYIRETYPGVSVINENVVDLPPASFNAVTLWDTFEHILDPRRLLDAISTQLAPGGLFFFSTPNTSSFEWKVMSDCHVQLLPPGHVNLYNVKNIKTLLGRHGFEVVDIRTMNPMLDLSYIRSVLEDRNNQSDVTWRAAMMLMDVVLATENWSAVQDYMRSHRMAGNMVVVARKNV